MKIFHKRLRCYRYGHGCIRKKGEKYYCCECGKEIKNVIPHWHFDDAIAAYRFRTRGKAVRTTRRYMRDIRAKHKRGEIENGAIHIRLYPDGRWDVSEAYKYDWVIHGMLKRRG